MRDPAPLPPVIDYLDHAAARRIVAGVLLTMLLAALDQVMVATALPTIAAELGDVDSMPWVVTANLLSGTAVTPLYGKLSDIHGRRTMILIAIGIYAAGSLACALAPSMLLLILARALQGAGGGGLMPLVQTIIGDVASPRDRPRYQALTSSTFIVSTVGGPLLGGLIAEHLHWSWIFWSNLPLCALAFFLTHNVLRRLPRHDRPHRLDLIGGVLMVGAAIVLMLALTWGGRRYAWVSPPTLLLLAVSATLWALFAWRMTTAAEPFIPLSVLHDGAMRVGTTVAFFAVGAVIALTIMLPLYAQLALGLSVTGSAWSIIALQGAATITSMIGGRLLVRFVTVQAGAGRRPARLHHRVHAAGARSDRVLTCCRARADCSGRAGIGPDLPVHHRGRAELGGAASTGHRDRHLEFLSRPRLDLHRGRFRRHRARGCARDPRHADGGGTRRLRRRRCVSLGVRRRHRLSLDRARLHAGVAGTPIARIVTESGMTRVRGKVPSPSRRHAR